MKKRLGRGIGSGKGKTAGRGTKGQKARGKIPAVFTGSLAFFKKLPLKRGKSNRRANIKPKIINLEKLSVFKAKTVIDETLLLENKLISPKELQGGVKILDKGEIAVALLVKVPVSASARKKIEKAGGKVENA